MDENADAMVSVAEWRGNAEEFPTTNVIGDEQLTEDEFKSRREAPFQNIEQNKNQALTIEEMGGWSLRTLNERPCCHLPV